MKLKEELKRHESEKLKSTENLVKLYPVKPLTFNSDAPEFPVLFQIGTPQYIIKV